MDRNCIDEDLLEMVSEGRLADGKTGSVKAAISSYRVRLLEEANPAIKKFQTSYSQEKGYTTTRELRRAMRDTDQFNETRKLAETATAEAESELAVAKRTVKDLTSRIEESSVRVKGQMEDLERLNKVGERKMVGGSNHPEESEYERVVMRELESVKRELSKVKLDMMSVLEEKRRAEKEREESLSRAHSYTSSLEVINKEIEVTNEEHVLVELARIEAVREYEQVEAQRKGKAAEYTAAIEEIHKKMQDMLRETEDEELEKKLAITELDTKVLANELKLVKEMDKRLNEEDKSESEMETSLHSVMEELEAARKELESVRDESFQLMASMDVARQERKRIRDEVARQKIKEEKTETSIQNLNTKLLRAKTKLEAATAAEEKAKSITLNLSTTLERLRSEREAAKKEHALINEETASLKADVTIIENEIDAAEDRLQIALQDLKAAKSSEAAALENLKTLTEKTMKSRASVATHISGITISKFEYEYLTGHAAGAQEIADKKVAAAKAWIEVLKASEKEMEMKYELLQKECRELKAQEETEVSETEEGSTGDDNEFEKWRRSMGPENLQPQIAAAYGSKTRNRNSMKIGSARRGKGRAAALPMVRGTPRTTSFTVRRRRKVIRNLAEFFGRKSGERN